MIDDKRTQINELGLDRIKGYFEITQTDLERLDKHQLKHMHNMARLGMQLEKEFSVTKRATEMNFIRVGKMLSENREELKTYIKKTLPHYT